MFTSAFGGPIDPGNLRRSTPWSPGLTSAGLTPHELRHSAASILLAQGVPLHVVSEMLGHSSIRSTKDVYGHLVAGEKREASAQMAAALYGR